MRSEGQKETKEVANNYVQKFESETHPGTFHYVRLGKDDVLYCTCPSWRYQHRPSNDRQCLHTRAVVADLAAQAQQYRLAA